MPNLHALHNNYNNQAESYEINYGYLTSASENSKVLRDAFIEKVNPLLVRPDGSSVTFSNLDRRTRKSSYHFKTLFTTFASSDYEEIDFFDGLILFVDSSNDLDDLIDNLKEIKAAKSLPGYYFSITVISHNDLEPNLNLKQAIGITPSYKTLQLADDNTLTWEQVASVISSMKAKTLDKNAPNVLVNTLCVASSFIFR